MDKVGVSSACCLGVGLAIIELFFFSICTDGDGELSTGLLSTRVV